MIPGRSTMKSRFISCLVLVLLVSLLLSACSLSDMLQPLDGPGMENTAPSEPTAQEQIRLLINQAERWKQVDESGSSLFYYAVTDLDWNGRLEIIAASTQGTGIFTYGTMYEVSEDYTSVQACVMPCGEGEALPEIIMNFVPAAFDPATGTYYYIFKDDYRNGAAEYGQAIMPLSLHNGAVTCETLAWMHLHAADGITQEEYHTPEKEITPAEYEAVISDFQARLEGFTANFEWFTISREVDEAVLTKSWEIFQSSRDA